jgi:predicted dienelactone hydrolase
MSGFACRSVPATQASGQGRFDPPKGESRVPTGKDVMALTQGGNRVGYQVMSVSATDAGGTRSTTDVAVWYPTEDAERPFAYDYGDNKVGTKLAEGGSVAPGRYPLVVFSHGATGSGLTSAFVTETLARHGFIVAAVDHTDSMYLARIRPGAADQRKRGQALRALSYAMMVRTKYLGDRAPQYRGEISYRPAQIRATIDLLLNASKQKGSPFFGRVDANKIGIMGHSFGANTVMMVGGAVGQFADPRVGAVVTLSAAVNSTVFTPGEMSGIRVPMMMMFGSTEVKQGRGDDRSNFYDHLQPPKYMIEIDGADHTSFSGGVRKEYPTIDGYLKDSSRAAITRYAIAFMAYYLEGDAAAHKQLQMRGAGVSNYLFEEGRNTRP